MGQSYRRMEDQQPRPGLAFNQDFGKGGENLNQKLKSFPKMSKFGDMVSKLVQLKHITGEGLGAEPPAARGHGVWRRRHQLLGNLLIFFEIIGILTAFGRGGT